MGYRSTLISTNHGGHDLPNWFKDKWGQYITFPDGLTVASKIENKFYENDFFEDYQRAISESGFWKRSGVKLSVWVAVLGEDGNITKVEIRPDFIEYVYMHEMYDMDNVYHP